MKKAILPSILLAAISMMSFVNMKFHTDVFKVDTKQSVLQWYAEKLTGKHNGTIQLAGGELNNNHGNLTGTINFDMTTISNKDMDEGEWKGKLETHIKSADFFDVAKYPTAKFVLVSKNDTTLTGSMTIHGVTKTISFPVTYSDTELAYKSTFTLNMKEFGIDQKFANETIELSVTVPLK